MSLNIFEDLQEKKQRLLTLANTAADYGWIPRQKASAGQGEGGVISLEEIREKLDSDTLTIGVIGQMKCGKSTFLNSFVFKDDVLPAATTPMTAALSVITYGEHEHIVAEFYTADEWAEQQQQAERSLDDVVDALDESKVKAAKELVSKASKLGDSPYTYLGKTQEDSFANLIEYVGADGKFVSITKQVTIYYPHEYLKGVEVVDTPGFNDPIVSREERTKEFLKKADVVVMMLYAGRPFDATDRDIIFKNVRQCGIGKVLIGINKYDIPYCNEANPEDENQIKDYVISEIQKACRECGDNTLVELLNDAEPIPFSAEMALLSELPMSKIGASEAFDFAWKRHCTNFGISTQQEMREWSRMDEFVAAIQNLIKNEKDKILFGKPLNAIIAAGAKLKTDTENELNLVNSKIQLLMLPDTDVEEKEENLSKAHRRLTKKIESLGEDLDADIQNIVRKGKYELEDVVDATCRNLTNVIENEWGHFNNINSIKPKLDAIVQKMVTRDLKRAAASLAEEGKRKINRSVGDFFADAEDILMRYLPDFDSRDFVRSMQNKVQMDIEQNDIFSYSTPNKEKKEFSWGGLFGNVVDSYLAVHTFGAWVLAKNSYTHNDIKRDTLQWVNSICANFNPDPYLQSAFHSKDAVIGFVKQSFIADLIEPLQAQLQEIKDKKADTESQLNDATAHKQQLEQRREQITAQTDAIKRTYL